MIDRSRTATDRPHVLSPTTAAVGDLAAELSTALPADRSPTAPPRLPLDASPHAVAPRTDAVVDAETVHVISDAAVKDNTFLSRPGYPSGATNLQTTLHVHAWIRNSVYEKTVWVDVHVFGPTGALVHSVTLPLHHSRAAGDGGDVFVLDERLYQGPVATPGSVDLRPDVRVVQYRLYGAMNGRVYTDGVLHYCTLHSDIVSG